MKFIAVDPKEVPNMRESHRGRVSYPILKSFLETGIVVAKLDRTGMQQSLQALYSSLRAYIMGHELPIKLFSRSNEIYLIRLDLNADGTPNPDWKREEEEEGLSATAPTPITPMEVRRKFRVTRNQVTR